MNVILPEHKLADFSATVKNTVPTQAKHHFRLYAYELINAGFPTTPEGVIEYIEVQFPHFENVNITLAKRLRKKEGVLV